MTPLLVAGALAAELVAWAPGGDVHPGERVRVGVWCERCVAQPSAGDLRVSGASVLSVRANPTGGWLADLAVGGGGGAVEVSARVSEGTLRARVPVVALPAAPLAVIAPPEALVAEGRLSVTIAAAGPIRAEDVEIRASEGTIGVPRSAAEGLAVEVTLSADRAARPLLIGAFDRRHPGSPPATAVVRLRARHSGTVAAEAGSKLTIRVGGRSYGPFLAGPEGTAAVAFDALPGESSYELVVSDDLGNTSRIAQPVPTSTRPALVAFASPGEAGGELWLAAVDPRGSPVNGAVPQCRTGAASPEPAIDLGKGRWRWSPPVSGGGGETPVGCTLLEASVTAHLSPPRAWPASISLRFYPEILSADFPLAEVQATLVDEAGDRLPPEGLELTAALGAIRLSRAGDSLRGDYDGTNAAGLGSDELRARWSRPAGNGAPAHVDLCAERTQSGVVGVARVVDASGGPLAGVPVDLARGASPAIGASTDARGFARWTLEDLAGSPVLSARAGAASAQTLAPAGPPLDTGCVAAAAPTRADLDASITVPIRSGRVRQVSLETEPRTLTLGPGATAEIRLRMLDAAGGLVRDEPVALAASEGSVSPAQPRGDGSFVATFTPSAESRPREVTITATSSAGTVSTTLSVAPRPVRGDVSAGFGWVSNLGAVSSPYGVLSTQYKLPVGGLAARVGVGVYGIDEVAAASSGNVHVTGSFFPVDLGVTLTDRGPHLSLGAGVSLALIPYTLTADFGGNERISGPGFAPPGVEASGSAGWRVGQTEAFAEAGYLLFTAPPGAVTLAQNAGGLHVIVGYRVLY